LVGLAVVDLAVVGLAVVDGEAPNPSDILISDSSEYREDIAGKAYD
jgi:hypothetical protein